MPTEELEIKAASLASNALTAEQRTEMRSMSSALFLLGIVLQHGVFGLGIHLRYLDSFQLERITTLRNTQIFQNISVLPYNLEYCGIS